MFEGYDELTENQRTEGSILTKLLIGDCLPKATIMVTSRPLASDNLCPEFRESVDQHIEVVGFNDKDIKSYVKSACLNHPKVLSDLLSYITFNPFVSSIMFIPLLLYCRNISIQLQQEAFSVEFIVLLISCIGAADKVEVNKFFWPDLQ